MLLAIDIGNSSTKFGVYEQESLVSRVVVPTGGEQTADEINSVFQNNAARKFSAVVVSSVVPEANEAFRRFAEKFHNVEPIFVKTSLELGLKIKYTPPETLGVDRLVAAFAAVEKYGKPCVVCDFGTATTIDAVNSRSEYLGGIIAPGMDAMRESLFLNTAVLPLVKLRKPENVIGNSTVTSIQSGIYFGYISLVDGVIERMTSELGEQPKVVATGGLASVIAESSEKIETVDENLMLEGLRLIYEKRLR